MKKDKKTLEEVLVLEKFVTEEELNAALDEVKVSGRPLDKVLTQKGLLDEEGLARVQASVDGISFIKLSEKEIDSNVVRMVSTDIAKKHNLIPVDFRGNTLYVAMIKPSDLAVINEVKLVTGCDVQPMVTTEKEIRQAIDKYLKVEEVSKQSLIDMRIEELRDAEKVEEKKEREEKRGKETLEEIPSVKLVNDILIGTIERRASDIHFEPQDPEMIVRYRIDGIMYDIMSIPMHVRNAVISRLKIMAKLNITETRRPQDGHITFRKDNKTYDFRMSTLLTVNGEKVVLRFLDKETMLIGLGRLGFTLHDEEIFKSLIKRPFGMILVTGPTGSGKTTTLYAVLNQLEIKKVNIITIENPVEYKLSGINQIQIDPDIGITFASGLRTILRQDPDVILVGEIRDKETAEIAIHAALTGHLVFSTLHTNDAVSAINRLIDMGIEPFMIASTVIGCIAQRLCRKICPECKTEYEATERDIGIMGEVASAKQEGKVMLKKGKGCDFCFYTGYKGREAIFEILKVTDAIKNLIISRATAERIEATAKEEGMRTIREDGIRKILEGVSTLEEVRRIVNIGREV